MLPAFCVYVKQEHDCSKRFCRHFLRIFQTNKCMPAFMSMKLKGANLGELRCGHRVQRKGHHAPCLPALQAFLPWLWQSFSHCSYSSFSSLLLICKLCVVLESSAWRFLELYVLKFTPESLGSWLSGVGVWSVNITPSVILSLFCAIISSQFINSFSMGNASRRKEFINYRKFLKLRRFTSCPPL